MIRSVRIHEFGGADVLKIEDAAVREPGPGQVRLRIHAVGLNRTEVTLRSGRSPVKPSLPCSVGFEAAGVIEALGPDVSGFVVPRNMRSMARFRLRRRAQWWRSPTMSASPKPRRYGWPTAPHGVASSPSGRSAPGRPC